MLLRVPAGIEVQTCVRVSLPLTSRVDSANIHLKAIQAGYSVMQHTNASQSGLLQIIFLCKGWMGVFAFGFTFLFLSLTQLVSIDIAYFTLIMIFHVA